MKDITNVYELVGWAKVHNVCNEVLCTAIECINCFASTRVNINTPSPTEFKNNLQIIQELNPIVFKDVNTEPVINNLLRMILLGDTDYSKY